ncbi:Rhodanese-like domain-containing protein 11 [Nymphaea thermarum]|nr:Rhodanese-like domain-containing protein 11 [Nymphaea thermarum]
MTLLLQVRQGKVVALSTKEAGYAVQLSNKALLDVRPSVEHKKVVGLIRFGRMNLLACGLCRRNFLFQILSIIINYYLFLYSSPLQAWVKGSTWIPLFDVDDKLDIGTLSRNIDFIGKVEEKFPKDADLILACQKGLRSLAACEQLYNAGYRKLFWIQGGLESAEDGVFV